MLVTELLREYEKKRILSLEKHTHKTKFSHFNRKVEKKYKKPNTITHQQSIFHCKTDTSNLIVYIRRNFKKKTE